MQLRALQIMSAMRPLALFAAFACLTATARADDEEPKLSDCALHDLPHARLSLDEHGHVKLLNDKRTIAECDCAHWGPPSQASVYCAGSKIEIMVMYHWGNRQATVDLRWTGKRLVVTHTRSSDVKWE